MFNDMAMLTGKELGREVERQLYGVDCDAPRAVGHFRWLTVDQGWAVTIGHNMARHYNKWAPTLCLPVLLTYKTGPIDAETRNCELQMLFMGGFEVRYMIADPLEYGMHVGLILHRLIRRARKAETEPPKVYGRLH
jgi:hypothetical protein